MIEQQSDQPLYPKVLWNRPVSRSAAGRLLVVGGHQHSVASLQGVYQITGAAGIGTVTVLAPDALRPLLGAIPELEFGPSTSSGSLAKAALAQLIELASYADAILVGPDLSNNSETAILVEHSIGKSRQPLTLADAGLEIIAQTPDVIRGRSDTLVILTMQQLFRLAGKLELPINIRPDSGLLGKVDILAKFWQVLKVDLALIGPEIIIKVGDQISTTGLDHQPASLPMAAMGILATSYTQNPKSHYEGLTTGAFLIKQAVESATNASINQICASLTKALDAHEI